MKSMLLAILIVVFLLPAIPTLNLRESGSTVNLESCCWAWDGSYPSSLGNALGKPEYFPSDGGLRGNGDSAMLGKATLTNYMVLILSLLVATVSMMFVFIRKEL